MNELSTGLILPGMLDTHDDDGNTPVLRQRVRMRGTNTKIVLIKLDDAVPIDLDIYTAGGSEDVAQTIAVKHLISGGGIKKAAEAGKQIPTICTGFQIPGNSSRAGGRDIAGLGLVNCITDSLESRAIGEICTLVNSANGLPDDVNANPLAGSENHMGRMTLGADAKPLDRIARGVGNTGPEVEQTDLGIVPGMDVSSLTPTNDVGGAVRGSIICTHLYGPVLARSPQLADLLLVRATNQDLSSLAPLDPEVVDKLREEHILSRPRSENERQFRSFARSAGLTGRRLNPQPTRQRAGQGQFIDELRAPAQ